MPMRDITAIRVEQIVEKSRIPGRKGLKEERLCLETLSGNIYLRQTTLEAIGDSWDRVKNYFVWLSEDRGIPYVEETE